MFRKLQVDHPHSRFAFCLGVALILHQTYRYYRRSFVKSIDVPIEYQNKIRSIVERECDRLHLPNKDITLCFTNGAKIYSSGTFLPFSKPIIYFPARLFPIDVADTKLDFWFFPNSMTQMICEHMELTDDEIRFCMLKELYKIKRNYHLINIFPCPVMAAYAYGHQRASLRILHQRIVLSFLLPHIYTYVFFAYQEGYSDNFVKKTLPHGHEYGTSYLRKILCANLNTQMPQLLMYYGINGNASLLMMRMAVLDSKRSKVAPL